MRDDGGDDDGGGGVGTDDDDDSLYSSAAGIPDIATRSLNRALAFITTTMPAKTNTITVNTYVSGSTRMLISIQNTNVMRINSLVSMDW